jgi:hypothetical protein
MLGGFHAELFTYCLHIKLKPTFTNLQPSYSEVPDKYTEPCFILSSNLLGKLVKFSVFSQNGGFRIQIAKISCSEIVSLENTLKNMGYSVKGDFFQMLSSRSDIEAHLKTLDEALGSG